MRSPKRRRALVSTAAAAAVIAAPSARAERVPAVERPDPTPACSVELVPDAVTAGRPDTRVLAESTASARARPDVEVPPASGIRVREVRPDVSAGSWVLLLDLTDARAGGWSVTLRGDGFRCSGRLTIRESAGGADSDAPGGPGRVGGR